MKLTLMMTIGILVGLLAGYLLSGNNDTQAIPSFDPTINSTLHPSAHPLEQNENAQLIEQITNLDHNQFRASQSNVASLLRLKDRCKIHIELRGRSGFSQLDYFFKHHRLLAAQRTTFYYPNASLAQSQPDTVPEQEGYSHEVFNPQSERVQFEFASILRYFPAETLQQCQKF